MAIASFLMFQARPQSEKSKRNELEATVTANEVEWLKGRVERDKIYSEEARSFTVNFSEALFGPASSICFNQLLITNGHHAYIRISDDYQPHDCFEEYLQSRN